MNNENKERDFGSYQEDAVQEHSHDVTDCSDAGNHQHYIGYSEYPTYEAKIMTKTYQHQHVCDYSAQNKKGNRITDSDGKHKHDIVIGSPVKLNTDLHVDTETRPKNIALLYCIKVK